MSELFRSVLASAPNGGGLFLVRGEEVIRLDGVDTTGIDHSEGIFLRGEQPDRLWITGTATAELAGQYLDDVHDVLCVEDSVYVVSTTGNQVVELNLEGGENRRWVFPGEPDSRHLNCLAYWRGEVVFSSFGEFAEHRGYKGNTRGSGLVQSLLSGSVLIDGLSQPHSLVPIGDNLLVANSEEFELREYDAQARLVRKKTFPGYTRGIAVDGSVLYVGLSKSRNVQSGGQESAMIIALDASSWVELGRVYMPAAEIYSLKAFHDDGQLLEIVGRMGGHLASRLQAKIADISQGIHNLGAERDAAFAERDAALILRDDALVEAASSRNKSDAALADLEVVRHQRDEHEQMVSLIMASRSWRMTRPLRFLARLLRQGLAGEDRRRLGMLVRRYYQRLPIPFAARKKISAAYRWFRRNRVAMGGDRGTEWTLPGPEIFLAPAHEGKPDYVFWGVIDWHFRHQRPQQLALEIAESSRRVFYVSATLVDRAVPGFDVEPIGRSGRLFSVRLFVKGSPQIYSAAPSHAQAEQLRLSIGRLLAWARTTDAVSLVQHPFWLAAATALPGARLVYDCMDHHEGFGNVPAEMIALERALLAAADLTVTTSAWLDEIVSGKASRRAVIRNASEFEHFERAPENLYVDRKGRRIIGYYGAIAEWFDVELVEKIARRFPECCVLLVGSDTVNAKGVLGKCPNVVFTGEIPYAELPRYLHAFSVCMLPFRVIPLTLATNPVKVYEYLSAGKPVVAVDLPEMSQFDGLVDVARDHDEYIAAIARRLGQADDAAEVAARRAFAREQTWSHRAAELVAHAESAEADPLVSVIVVTYNNIELTRACLSSLDEQSHYDNVEIIVVDNASGDGSPEFLSGWARGGSNRKLVLNAENRGFAGGNNDGLAIASGEYLVLLNNDTYVTPGWIRTMVNHVRRDATIGLLGPVTNNIGNEARIDIAYDSMEEMLVRSADYTRWHLGRTFPLRTAAFFCVMIPRHTYEQVGPLDEAFGRGFFEDDDYCRRVEQLGLRVVCAEDVFIHHHLSASFNKLKQKDRQQLFEENRKIYEAKWGEWIPHGYRDAAPAVPADVPDAVPALNVDGEYLAGRCGVCGKKTRYHYVDASVWRESLTCEHCLTTSRYRSVGRGVLRAIGEACGIQAGSLVQLPKQYDRRLRVYDTQPPFYYLTCAYPLPDLLRATGWIDVFLSQYKPSRPAGEQIAPGITNQNLESLTFPDEYFDIVITSDVMEHVRLDARAHREIHRVLKPGGAYVFTVPHDRRREDTLVRVQVTDPDNPAADVHLLEPEYHGDTNSDDGGGVLSYRVYGRDLEAMLAGLGFEVQYSRDDLPAEGIMSTELYYCRKVAPATSPRQG